MPAPQALRVTKHRRILLSWLAAGVALSVVAGLGSAALWHWAAPVSVPTTTAPPRPAPAVASEPSEPARPAEAPVVEAPPPVVAEADSPAVSPSAAPAPAPSVVSLQRTLGLAQATSAQTPPVKAPDRRVATPVAAKAAIPASPSPRVAPALSSTGGAAQAARGTAETPSARTQLARAGRGGAATRLDIPLRLDGLRIGDIAAYLSPQEELVAFDGLALLKILERFLLPAKVGALRARIASNGRLAVADIEAEGLDIAYDVAGVAASVSIPLDMRTTQSLSLANPYGAGRELLAAASVSGYLNLLAGRDFVPERQGAQPVVLDFDGAVNVLGTVVEGLATYRDVGAVRWSRGDTRLVRDDPETRTRYSAGDLSYGTDGFQSRQRAAGFAVARNFGLQPYRSSAPVGQTDLELDRNSRVDIIVNGQRMRTIDLTPGRYNVRDLPLVGGTNDVTLRVTDEVGRVDVIRFPFVFDSTVLAEGEQDFGYAVGVESQTTAAGRKYDASKRVISAFHTLGLTDQLTIGGNYQGTKTVNALGAEARVATSFGTFRLDTAVSKASFAGTGAAVRLQHRFSEATSPGGMSRSIASIATYRNRSFSSIGQTVAGNPVSLNVAMLYSQRLYGDLYGSLGIGRQFARDGQANVSTVDANLSYQIAPDVSASLLLSTRQASFGGNDNRIFLSVSWFPRGSGQRVGTSYDTEDQSRRVDWTYTPTTRVDAVQADLSVGRERASDNFDGRLGYTGYRFDAGVSHATTASRFDGGGSSPRTSLNAGTAIAFADGHFAVTRPISDSFAMFVPHPTLVGKPIEINRVGDTPAAQTDLLGSAVLPELSSYYQHHVTIDAPDLPLGYDLGRSVYDLLPSYRSGTMLTVGTGAVVLGDGILVDTNDKALGLELGTIVSLDDPSLAPIEFFTSRSGRFRVEGLSPGRFRLTLANDPDKAIELSIPPGSVGRLDLGRLVYPIVP